MTQRIDESSPDLRNTMIPDLLREAPQARGVLDRYGLRGCGGPLGPAETLEYFARAHDVPIDQLVSEIESVLRTPTRPIAVDAATSADTIYAPFFKAGIAVVLTLGAVWGAYLLLRIGASGSFTSVGIHEVNAHGHAQIFGWVGLFVMGFAYQAFPRFKHTSLWRPDLALATLWMMLAGIVARSGAQAFLHTSPAPLAMVGITGSVLETFAVALFAWIVVRTLQSSGKRLLVHDYFILSALFWFFAQSVYETVYFATLAYTPDREALLGLVSMWQAPLRDIQIHGFMLLMILGVSHRVFHNFYGLPTPNPRRSAVALVLLNGAVVGEAAGFVLMRGAGHVWASLWWGSTLALAGATLYLVSGWRIYSKSHESDRSLKFLRTAYLWLFVSLGMLVFLPVYQFGLLRAFAPESEAAQLGFSHAYYGAIRHAITVGFVSLMIMGVAAKVAPTLKGLDVRRLSGLWVPFILINIGCAMRVGFQTLTDFNVSAFPLAGVSGLFEVAALAIWGVHVWRIISGRLTMDGREAETRPSIAPGSQVLADHMVGDVLDTYPGLLPTFVEMGFRPLANPVARATVARRITIESASRHVGVSLDELLERLNAARAL